MAPLTAETISPGTTVQDSDGLRKWVQRKRPAVERLFGRINSGGETPISNDKVISVTAEDTVTGKPAIIVTASEAPVIADMSEWFIFEYIEEELEELEETAALPETIMRSRSQSTDDLERAVQSVAGGSANEQQQQQPLVERLYHQRKQEEQARIKRISIDPSRFDLSKTELKRQRAIYELIMTERAFVKDMQILCNLFMQKIKEKKLLNAAGVKRVFANAEEIVRVSEELHRKLCMERKRLFEEINGSQTNTTATRSAVKRAAQLLKDYPLGQILNQMAPYFRSYTIYCGNHREATEYLSRRLARTKLGATAALNKTRRPVSVMTRSTISSAGGNNGNNGSTKDLSRSDSEENLENDENLAAFLQYCSYRPECRRIDLFGFLLKPIQRICKYPLLLREILSNTDRNHPDHSQLTLALQTIEKVVMEVNERRRFMEGQQQRMIVLRRRLLFDETVIVGGPQQWLEQQFNSGASSAAALSKPPKNASSSNINRIAPSPLGGIMNNRRKFGLLNEPSRRVINEAEDVLQMYSFGVNNDATDSNPAIPSYIVHRSLLLFSDVFMVCRLPEQPSLLNRLWYQLTKRFGFKPIASIATAVETPKSQVRLIVKLSELQSIQRLDRQAITTDNSVPIYPWSVTFNKTPLPDIHSLKNITATGDTVRLTNTRQRKLQRISLMNGQPRSPPRETVTLTFASATEEERDQFVAELTKYSEEMKHDLEGRKRLLSRNGGGDSNPALFSAVDKFAIGKTAMINGSSMAISAMTPSESQQHNDAVDVHDIPITLVGGVE